MSSTTILIGPTGFLGLSFLEKRPNIIAVGRAEIPSSLSNEFIKIDSIDDFSVLDSVQFENVIFLIGSSDHEKLPGAAIIIMVAVA